MGILKLKNNDNYFENLNPRTKKIVKDLMTDLMGAVEGHKSIKDIFENIECKRRDGFIPSSDNLGGIVARQFTDLNHFWGSGETVAHEGANKEIQRQIDNGLQCARESFFENNKQNLEAIGITSAEQVSYSDLYDNQHKVLAEDFSNYEYENLSDDSSSIMFETRFMYHGQNENGLHSASVSCAVNTEGPYHRSSIPWAPGVFCEGAKEITITWRTNNGLKRYLKNALKKTSEEVF